jgi:hypothetical protein
MEPGANIALMEGVKEATYDVVGDVHWVRSKRSHLL